MTSAPGEPRFSDVRRRFDRCAEDFDGADFVHRTAFDGLLERLAPVSMAPSVILDLGSATGNGSRQLGRMFRRARVISLDASARMLQRGHKQRSLFSKVTEVQGDARQLPLPADSVDLVVANMLLPWIVDLPAAFDEIARVLRKDGVFAFASLGPDSFSALRDAWLTQDQDWHVNAFPDMHDVGDLLMRAGLRDPVLDVDTLSVTYRDTGSLYQDLKNCGARNNLAARRKTLTGRSRFGRMEEALRNQFADGPLELRLELVYGHAWGGGPVVKNGEFHVAPAAIGRRQR